MSAVMMVGSIQLNEPMKRPIWLSIIVRWVWRLNMSNRVSFSAASKFLREYDTEPKYKHLRLGQAFINEFYPNAVNPELFYVSNYFQARNIIFADFVEFDNE